MSELVPEVNDLWKCESDNAIFQIYKRILEENRADYCYIIATRNDKDFLIATAVDTVWIVKNCKYLGKSKADINQLFEVQDD